MPDLLWARARNETPVMGGSHIVGARAMRERWPHRNSVERLAFGGLLG